MGKVPEKQNIDENSKSVKKVSEYPLILHAEDDLLNQSLTRAIFKKYYPELQILQAENGHEAIEMFRQHSVNLILMDINMPKKNGITAAKEIRAMEAQSEQYTPIVALTGMEKSEIKERCLNAGMDDILVKPIERNKLNELFNKYLPSDYDITSENV